MNNTQSQTINIEIDPKTGIYYTTEFDEKAEYLPMVEYIRRRHEADLKKDSLASPLYETSIKRVVKRGDIVLYKQGVHYYIDWNKYQNWIFHRHKKKK